jgi:glycosyltransferase involved in cell wall biosynthesis
MNLERSMAPSMPGPVPLVSVIIPTFNRLKYLKEAVASVFAQTYAHWELIVVDDGSTDDTLGYLSTLADPRVCVIRGKHSGNKAHVRNLGVARARGEYVAFLDSDDLWEPAKLGLQLEYLRANRGCRWCYTQFALMDEAGNEIPMRGGGPWRPYSGLIIRELVKLEAAVTIISVLVERSLFYAIGRFDENLMFREDYDLALRMAASAETIAVPRMLCRVRDHPGRSTSQRDDLYDHSAKVFLKFGRLTTDAEIRDLCHQRGAYHLVAAADRRIVTKSGDGAFRRLIRAWRYYPLYGRWWIVFAKFLLFPVLRRLKVQLNSVCINVLF